MPVLFNKEKEILPIVKSISSLYSVPVTLILAHIKQESSFNPNAYRSEPAINDASIGLMQVLVRTAQGIDPSATKELLYNPTYNIKIGTSYIAQNLAKYGNIKDAIAAYNAGYPRKNSQGIYVNSKGVPNVQEYVDKVYNNYLMYNEWLNKGAGIFEPSMISPWLVGAFLASGVVVVLLLRRRRGKNNRLRIR